MGYDKPSDSVLIVPPDDSRIMAWVVGPPAPISKIDQPSVGDQTDELLSSLDKFILVDSTGRSWKNNFGKLQLSYGKSIIFKFNKKENKYQTDSNWVTLQDTNTQNLIRHAGFVMWDVDPAVNAPEYDFAYRFYKQSDGTYQLYNDYGGGCLVGYDASIDRVLIVAQGDPRVVSWKIADPSQADDKGTAPDVANDQTDNLLASLKEFVLLDSAGRTWKNAYGRLQVAAGKSIVLKLNKDANKYQTGSNWVTLQDVETKNLIRHAGYVMWDIDAAVNSPEYDFAYRFYKQSDGTYQLFNDYAGGYFVGYDATTDRVLIVPPGDSRVVSWTIADPSQVKDDENRPDDQTGALMAALGKFTIKDSLGRSWKNNDGNLQLASGIDIVLQLNKDENKYQTDSNWVTLQDTSSLNLIRHAGFVMWDIDPKVNSPEYDFAYRFYKQGDGTYQIFNAYGGGVFVGYDASIDRVLIVSPDDSRIANWTISSL